MLMHPQFDPVALSLGPIAIHWYGLMYLFGFAGFYFLIRRRIQSGRYANWQLTMLEDLLFYAALGVVIGGRLGFIVFYHAEYYWQNPLEIIYIWRGGMSFHGGLIGVIVALVVFARKHHKPFLMLTDVAAVGTPIGLFFGRIGNFINAELPGRVSDVAWAMVFPNIDNYPRHPSQLYEALLEGLLLWLILLFITRQKKPMGLASGVFMAGYGLSRFLVEFTREPDAHLGLLLFDWSMGQWLSAPMVLFGVVLIYTANKSTNKLKV